MDIMYCTFLSSFLFFLGLSHLFRQKFDQTISKFRLRIFEDKFSTKILLFHQTLIKFRNVNDAMFFHLKLQSYFWI